MCIPFNKKWKRWLAFDNLALTDLCSFMHVFILIPSFIKSTIPSFFSVAKQQLHQSDGCTCSCIPKSWVTEKQKREERNLNIEKKKSNSACLSDCVCVSVWRLLRAIHFNVSSYCPCLEVKYWPRGFWKSATAPNHSPFQQQQFKWLMQHLIMQRHLKASFYHFFK